MSTEEVHDKEPVESAEGDESADGSMAKMRPRVERVLRSALAPRSMSKGVPVYVVAAVEKILSEVVAAAETNRAAKRKPRRNIDLLSLIAGVRNNPGLARAFRQYVFQATGYERFARTLQNCTFLHIPAHIPHARQSARPRSLR
jgi:hypothetical protein